MRWESKEWGPASSPAFGGFFHKPSCLFDFEVCTNAAKSGECCKPAFNQPVRILRIVPTAPASEIPGDLVERSLS